jgi:hypothetical protein
MSTEDWVQIVDVAYRYAHAIDTKDWESLATCFAENAVLDVGGVPPIVGREAILARFEQSLARFTWTQHVIGSPQVRIDGNRATGRFYLIAQHIAEDEQGRRAQIAGGIYEDEFEKTPEGWQFSLRRVRAYWTRGDEGVIHGGSLTAPERLDPLRGP